jgi:PEGA domain
MTNHRALTRVVLLSGLFLLFVASAASYAQNQVLGKVQFIGKTSADKTSGVWIDGQYVGYVDELKGDKEVLLLPGQHEISVRQSGYTDFTQTVVVEPGKQIEVPVTMERDPRAQFSKVTSQIKLKVTPDRAAVFVDSAFAGTVHDFGGVGRSMLVSPGKHTVKIDLPGFKTFETEVNLLPRQKVTIKTDLVAGSIADADPEVKN